MILKKKKPNLQKLSVRHCRAISDEEWKRFKRAVEGYRKADRVLSGEDTDGDINDIGERLIETN